MEPTPAQIKLRFKEFACKSDSEVQLWIDDAVLILNEQFWGVKYNIGTCYLVAHYMTLSDKSANGGKTNNAPVASRSVDGTSISYTTTAPKDQNEAYYMSTTYGQKYLALRKTLGVAACVI